MTYMTETLGRADRSEFLWFVRATFASAIKASSYFVALMKHAAAQEKTRKEIAELDARTLRDIGLEPSDLNCAWRSSRRAGC